MYVYINNDTFIFNELVLYIIVHVLLIYSITSDSLSKLMDAGRQKLWTDRADKLIVLVDSESKSVDISGKTSLPVMIPKDAIYKV